MMNKEPETVTLKGQIERVTFFNEENSYTVARVKIAGEKNLATVVGSIASPNPGEVLKMTGVWKSHAKYGEQFHVSGYETILPATVYGITKYLGSGLIKGIGPKMAKRIVKRFREKTLDVIENSCDSLADVEGIGPKRVRMIAEAWEEQREIRDVMIFLQSHGVSSGFATKIFKQYGQMSIELVQENPYRLSSDISGIGFVTADKIAEKLGVPRDSDLRAAAGVVYVLNKASDEGHLWLPKTLLTEQSVKLLEISETIVENAMETAAGERRIIMEENPGSGDTAVYLAPLHVCETSAAARIKIIAESERAVRAVDAEKAVLWVQKRIRITLAEKQLEAVKCSLNSKITVITGGPGTGKTTIINAIIRIFAKVTDRITLAAPTGRAAKRMTEASGHPASTIHRLLDFRFTDRRFHFDADHPLPCRLLIIDEASMIDMVLMHHLLKAVPADAVLILVGDVNQLPSVGPGSVLKDIMESGAAGVVELNEIFRQAGKSMIIVNAHRINQGNMPILPDGSGMSDFYFIEREEPEEMLEVIMELLTTRIPKRFGLDPFSDIQVLTPMHKGTVGAANLNRELQKALNRDKPHVKRGLVNFSIGDKVMQLKNNYDKKVYNGDMGRIKRINPEEQEVVIRFDEKDIDYHFSELDEINLAYAVSIHKAQGSEYPAVIIPVSMQHYILLQKNLIYTAVTRGKRLVIMVGTKKALAIGIKNDKVGLRYTLLKERLEEL